MTFILLLEANNFNSYQQVSLILPINYPKTDIYHLEVLRILRITKGISLK